MDDDESFEGWEMKSFGYEPSGMKTVPIPVGFLCSACDKPIEMNDAGVWMTDLREEGPSQRPWHRNCVMAFILGPNVNNG